MYKIQIFVQSSQVVKKENFHHFMAYMFSQGQVVDKELAESWNKYFKILVLTLNENPADSCRQLI